MINLIKMDLYRVIRNKSTWIMESLLLLLSIGMVAYRGASSQDITVTDLISILIQNGNLTIFIVIFNVILVNDKYKYGFIKNVMGRISKQYYFILSNTVVACIFILFNYILYFILAFINAIILYPSAWGNVLMLIKLISVQFLLHIAFSMCVICVTVIVRSSTIAIVAIMSYSLIFNSLFYMAVNYVINKIGGSNDLFSIEKYSTMQNIYLIGMTSSTTEYINAIISSVIMIGVGFAISTYICIKRKMVGS